MAKKTSTITRPPVVTLMGHVDHGKTSLLDAIRQTNVLASESGGITQHISAYQTENPAITFIDTPGHAAFTQMRSRGGQVADVVVLVVAADAGVKPQTKEAIAHIKAAGAPMLVAINKMDLPGANSQRVKEELGQAGVLVEGYGGEVPWVEVSATAKTNLDQLLEMIELVAEMQGLVGDPQKSAEGVVIESRLDPRRGPLATVLIRDGTLRVGDVIRVGSVEGRVRALLDFQGKRVQKAGPSTPVEVVGLRGTSEVGATLEVVSRLGLRRRRPGDRHPLDEVPQPVSSNVRTLNLVLKTDVVGTLEAIKASLTNLKTEESEIVLLHGGVGAITESDVLLAKAGVGMILGFRVHISSAVAHVAQESGVEVLTYNTIYELLEDIEAALAGVLEMEKREAPGQATVLKLFPLQSGDIILGCRVDLGHFKTRDWVELYHPPSPPAGGGGEEEPFYIGEIKKIKQQKEVVKRGEVGDECGFLLTPQPEGTQVGDIVRIVRKKRT